MSFRSNTTPPLATWPNVNMGLAASKILVTARGLTDSELAKVAPMRQARLDTYNLPTLASDERYHTRTVSHKPTNSVKFGTKIGFVLPRAPRELLSSLYLSLVLPALPKGCRWHPRFARLLIKSAYMEIGGADMGEWLNGNLNAALAYVHGKEIYAEKDYQNMNVFNQLARSQHPWQIDIPLMFAMNRHSEYALPLLRMIKHQVRLFLRTCHLEDMVLDATGEALHEDVLQSINAPTQMRLIAEYIHLSEPFASEWCNQLELQHRVQLQTQCTGDEAFVKHHENDKMCEFELRFNHLLSGLVLFFKQYDDETVASQSPTEIELNDPAFSPFSECTMLVDDEPTLFETSWRMRTTQWQRCGVPVPEGKGQWYLLPFSPHMWDAKPQCTLNFSKLNKVTLRFKINQAVLRKYPKWCVEIHALSFNIGATKEGMYGLKFAA